MTLGKLVIKCPLKPREDLWMSEHRRPEGLLQILQRLEGDLITTFPNVMVLVCNTMIDEEI